MNFNINEFKAKFEVFEDWYSPCNDYSLANFTSVYNVIKKFEPDYIIELGRLGGNSLKTLDLCADPGVIIDSVDMEHYHVDGLSKRVNELVFNFNSDDNQLLLSQIEKHERILIFWDIHDNDAVETFKSKFYPLLKEKKFCMFIHDFYMTDNLVEFETDAMHVLKDYCENKSNGFSRFPVTSVHCIDNIEAMGFREIELFYNFFMGEDTPCIIPKACALKELDAFIESRYFEENIYDTKYGSLAIFSNDLDL